MDHVEQLSVKLLARCSREMAAMVSECLCGEPDKRLVRTMLTEVRGMLDEFEDAYFDESGTRGA
jgi:hypothetical protein